MAGVYTQLYLHCVWATWDRLPMLQQSIKREVYAAMTAKCREKKCEALALGGIENHIHLLVCFPPTLSVSLFIKEVKGATSHLITHKIQPGRFFKWQGAYGAFTVSHRELSVVQGYIHHQREHHAAGNIIEEWEPWIPQRNTGQSAKADFVTF